MRAPGGTTTKRNALMPADPDFAIRMLSSPIVSRSLRPRWPAEHGALTLRSVSSKKSRPQLSPFLLPCRFSRDSYPIRDKSSFGIAASCRNNSTQRKSALYIFFDRLFRSCGHPIFTRRLSSRASARGNRVIVRPSPELIDRRHAVFISGTTGGMARRGNGQYSGRR
jgi:hypothetical protein